MTELPNLISGFRPEKGIEYEYGIQKASSQHTDFVNIYDCWNNSEELNDSDAPRDKECHRISF